MKVGSTLDLVQVQDRDEMQAAVAGVFAPHVLGTTAGTTLDASLRVRSAGSLKFVHIRYGAPVTIDVVPPPQSFHLVQLPMTGGLSVMSGNGEVQSDSMTGSVLNSQLPCSMRWQANCSEMILRIEDHVLRRNLQSLLGYPVRGPIRFALGMPTNVGLARSWRALVDLAISELDRDGGLLEFPSLATQLESMIVTGLLAAQPHNYSAALDSDQAPARPRAIRKAVEYIETENQRAITTAHVAAHLGISTRALQRGFQEHVGCTPMEYVRDIRLKRARDTLIAADCSSGVSVTEVALDAGFMHLGRFSVDYRRRFGESPSQTLRR